MAQGEPPPPGLEPGKRTYLYCARGMRVYPAAEVLASMGWSPEQLLPLAEGYAQLRAFGERVGCAQLSHTAGAADEAPLLSCSTIGTSRSQSSASMSTDRTGRTPPTSSEGSMRKPPTELASEISGWLERAWPEGRVSTMDAYEELEMIGSGAFSQALLLRESSSGRMVVAKQMVVVGLQQKQLAQLVTEVAIHKSLVHAHIVRLEGFHEARGKLSLLVSYAAGGTLQAYVDATRAAGRVIDVDLATEWLSQIASGLQYLHSRHVLHRDLSSANIFLNEDSECLIGDFGLSHKLQGHTTLTAFPPLSFSSMDSAGAQQASSPQLHAKTQCGTPNFLSPELVNGEPYGAPSDVWAFGVVLFEVVTLVTPFSSASLGGLIAVILRGEVSEVAARALEGAETTPDIRRMLSPQGLLCPDPSARMTLEEVLRIYPCREADRKL
jgi:serine/threonine protein kinase